MASAPHLIGAVRNFILAQSIPGLAGVVDGQAARDQPLPYLVIEAKDLRAMRIFGNREIQWVRIEFSVFAAGRSTAETIGNAIRDAILPGDDVPWIPLSIAGGWQDLNRQPAGGDAIEIDPEQRAALGVDVWCCRRPISWTISRG